MRLLEVFCFPVHHLPSYCKGQILNGAAVFRCHPAASPPQSVSVTFWGGLVTSFWDTVWMTVGWLRPRLSWEVMDEEGEEGEEVINGTGSTCVFLVGHCCSFAVCLLWCGMLLTLSWWEWLYLNLVVWAWMLSSWVYQGDDVPKNTEHSMGVWLSCDVSEQYCENCILMVKLSFSIFFFLVFDHLCQECSVYVCFHICIFFSIVFKVLVWIKTLRLNYWQQGPLHTGNGQHSGTGRYCACSRMFSPASSGSWRF